MVNNASKALTPHPEDGEINDTDKTSSRSIKSRSPSPSHKTYSILDNPLIEPPNGPRHVSAKVRKVLAWTKKLAMREARARQTDLQRPNDDRSRTENRDFRRPSRSRRCHPNRRPNDPRSGHPTQHRPRLDTSFTDDENEYDKESFDQPTPRSFNDYPSGNHRYHEERYHAQLDDQSTHPSDQQYNHQSGSSESHRSFQLEGHQSLYVSNQQSDIQTLDPESRRSSYPPDAPFSSRVPSTRPPPKLVPNYPPSYYHSYSQPSIQPPNIQEQPIHEYEPLHYPSFPAQQPLYLSQPSAIPAEYHSHPYQAPIPSSESYYPPQVDPSPSAPQPVSPDHDFRRDNYAPYYACDSLEQRRQNFHIATERTGQEPYPGQPSHSQPVVTNRFVSNYPAPTVDQDFHHSPKITKSSHNSETTAADPYQTSPAFLHRSGSVKFETNSHLKSPAHQHPEKDRIWRPEEAAQWDHETMRVDPYHQQERSQEFSRIEDPALVPLGPSSRTHFYPSYQAQDQVLHSRSTSVVKNPYEQQSQWYPIDDDHVGQKKEAEEIMGRLISWGVTADYLLSIGISESLVWGMYDR